MEKCLLWRAQFFDLVSLSQLCHSHGLRRYGLYSSSGPPFCVPLGFLTSRYAGALSSFAFLGLRWLRCCLSRAAGAWQQAVSSSADREHVNTSTSRQGQQLEPQESVEVPGLCKRCSVSKQLRYLLARAPVSIETARFALSLHCRLGRRPAQNTSPYCQQANMISPGTVECGEFSGNQMQKLSATQAPATLSGIVGLSCAAAAILMYKALVTSPDRVILVAVRLICSGKATLPRLYLSHAMTIGAGKAG